MESEDDDYYYSDEDEYHMEDEEDAKDGAIGGGASSVVSDGVVQQSVSVGAGGGGGIAEAAVRLKAEKAQQLEYVILTPDMLKAEQDKVVKNVCDVLSTTYDVANVLLLHFKWNRERLLDSYYADPEKACREAGALNVDTMDADAAGGRKDGESFLCQILFIEVPYKQAFSMGCTSEDGTEHRFSIDAWQSYLCAKVDSGKDCIFARCPAESCMSMVSPKTWEKVLVQMTEDSDEATKARNKDAFIKYQRLLATSFVDINRNMRWCPGKSCVCAVQARGAITEVRCSYCSAIFCFKCGLEAHSPISCHQLGLWLEKNSNESETANWILANTKRCPICSTRIEKNQGCNHMTCRQCRHDFCWICMESWANHGTNTGGYYNCNRYQGSVEAPSNETSRAKQELDRYLFYYKRWAVHEQAGKFADDQRQKVEARMVELQTQESVGWIDVQFLQQAVEQLIECRRVLKYTYAFAYCLPSGPKKQLFEYNQSMLESNTEKLSELSEMKLEEMDRSEVINFTRVTGKFLRSLLEQVERDGIGLDETGAAADVVNTPSESKGVRAKVDTGQRKGKRRK